MKRCIILSAFLVAGLAFVASPSSAMAREKNEKPKQEHKNNPKKDDKGGRHGGKHKDDGPNHK